MFPSHYTRIVLAERPKTTITSSTFRSEVVPFDLKLGPDEALIQVDYLSLDPMMRGWLNERRLYLEPVQIGAVMRGTGLGVVMQAGEASGFTPGDLVSGSLGWTEYVVLDKNAVQKLTVPDGLELLDFLGSLGLTGLTAYVGSVVVGKVQPGERLVVSGAAGATGSAVCQIGKQKGATVYAIAGSEEKCKWLEQELGVDKTFNYKSPTFHADFEKSVGTFDIFFDNVGGEILDFALTRMNKNARVILCGAISDYNAAKPRGLTNYFYLISSRAKIEGFVVSDHADRFPEAVEYYTKGLKDSSLKRKFHVMEGLELAPRALGMLFDGGNIGKMVVKVSSGRPVMSV